MDLRSERRHLEQAETHIAKGRRRLIQQRDLVDRLRQAGDRMPRQRQNGEHLLEVMEDTMRIFEGHRDYILEKLDQFGESRKRRE